MNTTERKRRANVSFIEGVLEDGARRYFKKNCWKNIATIPHVVGITGACENIDTLFKVAYFDKQAFLTQTGQLSLELLAPFTEGVTTTIHSFRAEEEVDGRHLTEFPLVEFEFRYEGDGFPQLLDHIEGTVHHMIREALSMEEVALIDLGADINALAEAAETRFERIRYDDAIEMLDSYGVEFGDDLKAEHEKEIVQKTGKPTFVTHYPEQIKFFNMRRCRKDESVVESTDLLLPFSGESVGGAVREHDPDLLVAKLQASEIYRLHEERGGSFEDFMWYLESVRTNPVPHAGCGIGLSRVAQYVLGEKDIRRATAYTMNKETDINKL